MKRLGLFLLPLLLAFSYYVDSGEGDAELSGHLQLAFDAWKELDENLDLTELREPDEAKVVFSYGNEALFGPDLYTLTVQGDAKPVRVKILPNAKDNQRVLRHEVGLLLGLSASSQGIMNPAISAEDEIALTETEGEALKASINAAKEDLNRDGKVDFYDLLAFAKLYGSSGFNSPADLNADGLVDKADLELLRAAYSFTPPAETPPNQADNQEDAFEQLLPEVAEPTEPVETEPEDTDGEPLTDSPPENPEEELNQEPAETTEP